MAAKKLTGMSFSKTVDKTNLWLKEIAGDLGWEDLERAYLALRVTLHALRDRLPVGEASDLGAQLPMLVRGLYYEGWRPAATPKHKNEAEFLDQIRAAGEDKEFRFQPEKVLRSVLKVLSRHVSTGELLDVKATLPAEIRQFFPTEDVVTMGSN